MGRLHHAVVHLLSGAQRGHLLTRHLYVLPLCADLTVFTLTAMSIIWTRLLRILEQAGSRCQLDWREAATRQENIRPPPAGISWQNCSGQWGTQQHNRAVRQNT